ncbi:histidine phosphatase family protein [Paenibacillus alkalitolerans]|uniref:histidine phosphatase family protein n=1 Tax=Paenibacillus alkalitolerans TaxID=2799335 RepID=UPI0018F6D1F1|nr:histidine phosphatase family protein [Paenibacillus alkalitolerans]
MSDNTIIYLVRHGQTEWNVQHRFQGHMDSPLTEFGISQAQWLGDALSENQIDLIFSSTSLRALKTAEIIRRDREVSITKCDDFKEINLGVWEGQTQETVKATFEVQFNNFWNNPREFHVENSETFIDVRNRALNKLLDIVKSSTGKSILIVTHTVVVKLLMAYFEKRIIKDLWNPPYIHPACLCKVEINNEIPSILLHGDISHYKEEHNTF